MIPMVTPPASCAPRQAAAIAPPRPPQTSVQPRSATRRPIAPAWSNSSSLASPGAQTAIRGYRPGGALQALGFTVGDEPYHPHITLGRVRNDDGERVRLRDLPEAVKNRFVERESGAAVSPPALPVPVREVVLMRSHLGKAGARHEPIANFPLGGAGSERR